MPRRKDQHYFLYGCGRKPAQLRLGHLCFGHYSQATDDSLWYFPGEDLQYGSLLLLSGIWLTCKTIGRRNLKNGHMFSRSRTSFLERTRL
jgi:hypothetical protein